MYLVTMRNTTKDENNVVWEFEAKDRVSSQQLNVYVNDARTRWTEVTYELESN